MTIVHVVEPFAAGIAVFVKSLTETMPAMFTLLFMANVKKKLPPAK
jgi:hypothetical protein